VIPSAVFSLLAFQSDDATFHYNSDSICNAYNNITPITQYSGIFTVNNQGLIFSDALTGTIDVVASNIGNYTITHTTNGICPNNSSQSFIIYPAPNATFSYAENTFCNGDSNQFPTIPVGSSSGIFNSFPNGLQIDSLTGEIYTNQSSNGFFTIYNTHVSSASCPLINNSFQVNIIGPEINFSSIGNICEGSGIVNLSALPVGGTFSGTGVSLVQFDPSQVSDSSTIYYTFSDASCTSIDSQIVIIRPLPTVDAGSDILACSYDTQFTLNMGIPSGGTYFNANGTQVSNFDPSNSNLGINSILYIYTDSFGCQSSDTLKLTVNESPNITFGPLTSVCDTLLFVDINTGSPIGGTYSGNGINNGAFYPELAGIGTHAITYTYSANNCTSSINQFITVDNCSEISEIKDHIILYPNPAENLLKISQLVNNVNLFTIDGKKVILLKLPEYENNSTIINLSNIPEGTYFISHLFENKEYKYKFIKN
jgi:hypothetical protein